MRVGDTTGSIRVYSLATLALIASKEAHEGEVLTLDYSPPSLGAGAGGGAGQLTQLAE